MPHSPSKPPGSLDAASGGLVDGGATVEIVVGGRLVVGDGVVVVVDVLIDDVELVTGEVVDVDATEAAWTLGAMAPETWG